MSNIPDFNYVKNLMKAMIKVNKKQNRHGVIGAIDLFCGVGGLTCGLEQAGIDVRLGVDIDPICQFPYETNNKAKFLLKSVIDLKGDDFITTFDGAGTRLLAGCAPCQTFSTYYQKAGPSDKRRWLLFHFARLIEEIQPHLVTMENVPKVVRHYVFKSFKDDLCRLGYHVHHEIVDCVNYGIPQKRQRLVLLASRFGPISLIPAQEAHAVPATVREFISGLPALEAGQADKRDALHQSSALSSKNLNRIRASHPGGTWRDWERALIADCHKKSTGQTYPSVYGRMCWDKPAPTITTQFYGFGSGRFGHPEQDRAISLREGAILQSFPKDYEFIPPGQPIHKKRVGRLIGNAVPPALGEIIGRSLWEHLNSMNKKLGHEVTGNLEKA